MNCRRRVHEDFDPCSASAVSKCGDTLLMQQQERGKKGVAGQLAGLF